MARRSAGGPVVDVAGAERLLEEHGVVTLVPARDDVPSLVTAIVGGPVKGSWWSHPLGKRIFAIGSALEESALPTKLLDGKITYVHRRLWSALLRVVTDPAGRRRRVARLSAAAKALLREVERDGELDLDGRPGAATARKELDRLGLVLGRSEHTDGGHHATTLVTWERWASPELRAEAARLDLATATAALAAAGLPLPDGGRVRRASRATRKR